MQCIHRCLFTCISVAGVMTRTRSVLQQAHEEGRPCASQLSQTKPCPISPCYTWLLSDWSPCTVEVDPGQKIIGSACILQLLVIAYHLTWGHSIHVSYDQAVLRPAARHIYLVLAQHLSSLIEFWRNFMRTWRVCVWEGDFVSLRREVTAD